MFCSICKHTQNSGRTMVEMLGVLTIIGILSAGGLVGYSKAMRRHRLNETISEIAVVATNIRSFYANTDNYTGFDRQTAVKYGMATERMIGVDDTLVNEYKGRIQVSLDKAQENGAENTAFVLTYRDLPVEACIGLARTDWGYEAKYGFIAVSVGSNDENPSHPLAPSAYFVENRQLEPLTMSVATEYCSSDDPQSARSTFAIKFY